MTSQLKSKNLWDYIVSTKIESDEDLVSNEKAKAIMYMAMDPRQISATGVCDTARELWIKIQENHEGALSNMRSTALAEFLSMKMHKNESIVQFAGRYENLLGKLELSCHAVDRQTKLWVFSNSLPQHYKLTVQMFTMSKPDGEVSELISQLKIQHHLDNQHEGGSKRDVALSVGECSLATGQTKRPASTLTCNYCKKPGHKWRECRKLKADNERKKRFNQQPQDQQRSNNQQAHQQTWRSSRPQQTQQEERKPAQQQHQNKHFNTGALNAGKHILSKGKSSWILDSGASNHMTPYRDYLVDYEEFVVPKPIYIGDGRALDAYGEGTMPFTSDRFYGRLTKVLWIPELSENLISVGRTIELGCDVKMDMHTANFYRDNKLVFSVAKNVGDIYYFIDLTPTAESPAQGSLIGASLSDWHKRLAHCNYETVKAMAKSNAVTGMGVTGPLEGECSACVYGKLCRSQHPSRRPTHATETAAALHLDTVGPFKTNSLGNSRFFLLATEELSGYKFFEAVAAKSSIPNSVKQLVTQAELISRRPIKAIVSDNGSEFNNNSLINWTRERGIIHYFAASYTPEQNGRAERANRSVLDGIRTLLSDSGSPESLWAECLNTVVYTQNRLLSRKHPTMTRYELLTGEKPDLSNLRIFGQKAIIREDDSHRDGKLAPRGEPAIFVGYTERHNTYRFYIKEPIEQVVTSCDAKFLSPQSGGRFNHTEGETIGPKSDYTVKLFDDDDSDSDATEIVDQSEPSSDDDSDEQPSYFRRVTRSVARSLTGGANLMQQGAALFTLMDEPRTVNDAKNDPNWPQWKRAMDEEIAALAANKTWVLVDKPPGARPIKNKWVFKTKMNPNGSVERFKARLVAKGFTQIPDVDFKETYAPVASMTTVRLLLAIANQESMSITQFDVKTAFLYGDLEEELYMTEPEGYESNEPNKVCKLIKSLYGLRQSPRQWNKKFTAFLTEFKLKQSEMDKCLYYNDKRSLILALYVDDGLIAGNNEAEIKRLIAHLKENFDLKTMDCKTFLGLKISRNLVDKTLDLDQSHYVRDTIAHFGMSDCKTASTPELVGDKLTDSEPLPQDNQFRELLGRLLYIATCTRPDISHAVNVASRTANPTQAHWVALKRILRYLKGTAEWGIRFRWEKSPKLVGFSDADYANDEVTRKSTTGYCIFYGGGPINWRCQRQPIITLSTTEAEYVAGCELVKEIMPIRQQLIELNQISETEPTEVYIDNQSAVKIATNESGQVRTKHIDIRAKWLTEQVNNKKIVAKHISGDEQAADILTKPLYKTKFATNRSKLMMPIITLMCLVAIVTPIVDAKTLKMAESITTIGSNKIVVGGDYRYEITSMIINPCDALFNQSNPLVDSGVLIKSCYEHFEAKHLGQLSNCKRLPTIGPDLSQLSVAYNCADQATGQQGAKVSGKCNIARRTAKSSTLPNLELGSLSDAWARHKMTINQLPKLVRGKRVIPALIMGASVFGILAGPC